MADVVLLDFWASPFGQRCRIALAEKGVTYEYSEQNLKQKSELWLRSNPVHKKIPILLHGGRPVCESLVILTYIDEAWPEVAPLLPRDPHRTPSHRYRKRERRRDSNRRISATVMARHENPFDMQIKLLMIGDSGVGKTCLLLRYANDSFSPTFITTIGIDFKIKNIELDSKKIKLQIWDTAGQERFRTITTSYFRGAQGILLVYDVTDRASFQSIRNWVGQIQQHADVHVNKILIGNKCDMTDDKVVSTEEGQALADEYGVKFFETSAKNNINVEGGFIEIAREVKNRLMEEGGPHKKEGVNLAAKPPQAKKGCC